VDAHAITEYKIEKEEMEELETENPINRTSKRLDESTGLEIETVALIIAVQDQALETKFHRSKILHTASDPKYSATRIMRQLPTLLEHCPG